MQKNLHLKPGFFSAGKQPPTTHKNLWHFTKKVTFTLIMYTEFTLDKQHICKAAI